MGEQRRVLDSLTLQIEKGEFVSVVGFSGSGKTTLVSILAGLLSPDQGSVTLDGRRMTEPSHERAVVFQTYALLPWLTAFENVYLAVDQVFAKYSQEQKRQHTERYLAMVGLSAAHDKRPAQLSGGMRQRVALARGLAVEPAILIMDEPLGALDALTRATLQDELSRIHRKSGATMVMVTNDVDEAVLLADRIVPLSAGPGATSGPSFHVDIERPRDRRAMNHDPAIQGDPETGARVSHVVLRGAPLGSPRRSPVTAFSGAHMTTAVGRQEKKFLELWSLGKSFGPQVVVQEFSLNVAKGEFVSIIGHSGCGKSTVLSMVAGLTTTDAGGIILENREVTGPGPDRGVVFQSPCLFPWMTARQNVLLSVEADARSSGRRDRRDIADECLTLVGLGDAIHKRPAELSAGMRQRVGLARAFALSPKLMLLDEPFGMLDSLTRLELQDILLELLDRKGLTALMVTHDVDEALYLSDRVVMMTSGPAARVGEISPFRSPVLASRHAVLDDSSYYEQRERLIGFLEDQAPSGAAVGADTRTRSQDDVVHIEERNAARAAVEQPESVEDESRAERREREAHVVEGLALR